MLHYIQRTLDGDEGGIYYAREEISEMGSYPCLAEDRGFPYRRRNHAGYFPEGVQKVIDAETSGSFSGVALCNCDAALYLMAPKEAATNDLLGCNAHS